MWTYLVKRILLMIVTLFGVAIVNFGIMHLAPGGPVDKKTADEIDKGLKATTKLSNEEQARREFHLHKPILLNRYPFRDVRPEVERLTRIRADFEYPELWKALVDLRNAAAGEEREAALERVEEIADEWNLKTLVANARQTAVDETWYELHRLYESNVATVVEESRKKLLDLERWAVPELVAVLEADRDRVLGILVAQVAARTHRNEAWEPRPDDPAEEIARKLGAFETWWQEAYGAGARGTPAPEVQRWLDASRAIVHGLDERLRRYLPLKASALFAEERLASEPLREGWAGALDRARAALAEEEAALVKDLASCGLTLPEEAIRAEYRGPSRGLGAEGIRWRILLDATRFLADQRSSAVGRNDVDAVVAVWLQDRSPRVEATVINMLAQIDGDDRNAIYEGASYRTARTKREYWANWWDENEGEYRYGVLRKIQFLFLDTRFARYMGDLAQLDLGKSFRAGREKVTTLIWKHLQVSFLLMLLSSLLVYVIAIPLGIYSSVRQGSPVDKGLTVLLFVLYSIPGYVTAVFLSRWLASGNPFSLLPIDRLSSPDADQMTTLHRLADYAHHLVLPVFCLSYAGLASISRYARVGMLDVIRQDYIRTARAKGVPESRVVLKHALRNGVIPLVTIFANLLPAMVSGSVIIEFIFSIQGMGFLAYESVTQHDYTTLMGINLITAVLVMLGILLSDILYAVVDPRITFD